MKNINSIDEMKKRVEVLSEDNTKNGSEESIVIFRVPKRKKKLIIKMKIIKMMVYIILMDYLG